MGRDSPLGKGDDAPAKRQLNADDCVHDFFVSKDWTLNINLHGIMYAKTTTLGR